MDTKYKDNPQLQASYEDGYQKGYLDAKKTDANTILNLQKIITGLRSELSELRDEINVHYRY